MLKTCIVDLSHPNLFTSIELTFQRQNHFNPIKFMFFMTLFYLCCEYSFWIFSISWNFVFRLNSHEKRTNHFHKESVICIRGLNKVGVNFNFASDRVGKRKRHWDGKRRRKSHVTGVCDAFSLFAMTDKLLEKCLALIFWIFGGFHVMWRTQTHPHP